MTKILNSVIEGMNIIGETAYDMVFGKREFDYFFSEVGIKNKSGHKPILRKIINGSNYKAMLFTIPTGLSINDFEENKSEICQFLHEKEEDVNIELVSNQALITIKEKLTVSFNYEDYEFNDELMIPIGINLLSNKIVYWKFTSPSSCHLMIGGATGSGKSVALNVIVTNIVKCIKNVKLYIQDTKCVDLPQFEDLDCVEKYNEGREHYEETIKVVVDEMNDRYKWMKERKCKNFKDYKGEDKPPYIFYIVEELGSFNSKVKDDVDFYNKLQVLLSQGRAAGINVIVTAQNPYNDILPGTIKGNINSKLCLKATTGEASKVLCGDFDLLTGLRGKGHGYFISEDGKVELQCFNIQDETVDNIIKNNEVIKPEEDIKFNYIIGIKKNIKDGGNDEK